MFIVQQNRYYFAIIANHYPPVFNLQFIATLRLAAYIVSPLQ
jgi:hypothetical protein